MLHFLIEHYEKEVFLMHLRELFMAAKVTKRVD